MKTIGKSRALFCGIVFGMVAIGLSGCITLSSVSVTPQAVNPTGNITLTYTITATNWNNVASVTLNGFPPNTGLGTVTLNKPTGSGVPATTTINIPAPASDGVYPLTMTINAVNPANTIVAQFGSLTINDVAASVFNVALTADWHSIMNHCQGGPPQIPVVFSHTVADNNGVDDVFNVKISKITGPAAHLTHSATPILLYVGSSQPNPNSANQFFDHVIDVNCDVAIGAYDWHLEWDENDKPAGTTSHHTFAPQPRYTVKP